MGCRVDYNGTSYKIGRLRDQCPGKNPHFRTESAQGRQSCQAHGYAKVYSWGCDISTIAVGRVLIQQGTCHAAECLALTWRSHGMLQNE